MFHESDVVDAIQQAHTSAGNLVPSKTKKEVLEYLLRNVMSRIHDLPKHDMIERAEHNRIIQEQYQRLGKREQDGRAQLISEHNERLNSKGVEIGRLNDLVAQHLTTIKDLNDHAEQLAQQRDTFKRNAFENDRRGVELANDLKQAHTEVGRLHMAIRKTDQEVF